jgi:hypothetical protein
MKRNENVRIYETDFGDMMMKKALLVLVLLLMLPGMAAAASGEVILKDTLYGAAIGGLLGGAWYLLDDDDLGEKIAIGVGVGAFAGFFLGLTDVSTLVRIDDDGMHFGIPTVVVEQDVDDITYKAGLLNVSF